MPEVILGVLVLIGLLFLGQMFAGANPKSLAKGLRTTGAIVMGLGALALLTVDRVGVATLLGSMAWGLYTGGHIWPGGWPHFGRSRSGGATAGGTGGAKPGAGRTTSVRTAWLELELDHETGAMRGTVLQGRYKDRALERMSEGALRTFYSEAAHGDAETARLLETYLDRRFGPGWRGTGQGARQERAQSGNRGSSGNSSGRSRARPDGGMSRDEAYAVLGLQPGAARDDIRAAHRKLMMQNHPDRGGSDYLAAKINEAKDVLLA